MSICDCKRAVQFITLVCYTCITSFLWLPCVADADIIFSSYGFFYLLFFLAYSQPSQIGCLPHFHTCCGLSANLECRSEMYCAQLAENTGRKKSPKNSPSGHHRTTLSGCIFATKTRIDNRKKNLRSVYQFRAFQQILTGFASWLHYCSDVAHQRPTKLCTIFGRLLGWYTVYTFWGLLPPDGILLRVKCTLRSSLAFSCIDSSGRQPNFAAWYKEWN